MNDVSEISGTRPAAAMAVPIEAYTSEAYARAENEKLWPKVWQVACRTEEIPQVGDYVSYDILDESIVVVRAAPDKIVAYYNVCQHRGRCLTEGSGRLKQFRCRFHGWTWDLNGENTFVLDPEDWGKHLNPENLRLKTVHVDTWGGWVWINMDANPEPLREYLRPATPMLDPFALDDMRYSWRQWIHFPCNWKTALEAFIESYHVYGSHPQRTRWGSHRMWSKAEGKHAWHGSAGVRSGEAAGETGRRSDRTVAESDLRVSLYEQCLDIHTTVVGCTTQTIVDAAKRLVDELPADTPPAQIVAHLMASAKRDDDARGVFWPQIDPAHLAAVGHDWHVFPNTVIIASFTAALCYRARPNGYNPDSCIFEVYALERFPKGSEPRTEWQYVSDPKDPKWRLILSQDFANMPQVQKGMKSRGFAGPRPSPVQESTITHFHQVLSEYMGTGAPQPLR